MNENGSAFVQLNIYFIHQTHSVTSKNKKIRLDQLLVKKNSPIQEKKHELLFLRVK